jgi:hypothetical protein
MDPELEAFIALFPSADMDRPGHRAQSTWPRWPTEVVDVEARGEGPVASLIIP